MDSSKDRVHPDVHSAKGDTESGVGECQIHAITALDNKRFNLWSVLGLQYSSCNSPISICGYMAFSIGVGGSPYYFWCLIVAGFIQGFSVVNLAELASAFPHVAGQTYWTAVLAPPKYRRFLTYFDAAMTFWLWLFALSGGCVLVGQWVTGIATALNPTYTPVPFHIFLIAVANAGVGFLINTYLVKIYSGVNKFFLFFINAAVVYIIVVFLVKAQPKADARTAFIDVVNDTGWSSEGLVFLLGFLPGLVSISLPDAATHLAEEVPNPQRRIPQVMVGNYVLSYLAAIVMVTVIVFCNTHPENLLDPIGGTPMLQLCKDVWDNTGFLITIGIIFILIFIQAASTIVTGLSRVFWAFAQCNGIPFGHIITKVDSRTKTPLNAIAAVTGIGVLFTLLAFAPSYVLNAIYGSAGCCVVFSYGIPIFLLVLDGRQSLPKDRHFDLGKMGWFFNVAGLLLYPLLAVVISFPLTYPVTAATMNWSSVVFIAIVLITVANWFFVRHKYELPHALDYLGDPNSRHEP